MSALDLSSIRAVVADDRADVRALVERRLRELGITRIDVASGLAAGQAILTLIHEPGTVERATPEAVSLDDNARDLISQFTHDVASPLLLIVALTDLVVRAAGLDEQTKSDLVQINGAAREVSGRVRALSIAAGSSKPGPRPAHASPTITET